MTAAISNDELAKILEESPFHQLLQLRLVGADTETESIAMEMPFNPVLERAPGSGQYHGGIIASFIDIAGDVALVWALGFGVPTINFRTDFIRPAFNCSLQAKASIRRIGRSIGVVDIDVFDNNNKLVAVGRGCYGTSQG